MQLPAAFEELKRSWRTLAGATIGVSGGIAALVFYSFSVLTAELGTRYGWSRSQLGLAHMGYAFTLALALPVVGTIVDRRGALRIIALSIAGETMVLLALALAPAQVWLFIALQIALAAAGAATTPLGYNRVISERFDRLRGFALACIVSGNGLCALLIPIVTSRLIQAYDWRAAYVALAGIAALLGTSGLLIVRSEQPLSASADEAVEAATKTVAVSLWPLLRRPLFWHLLAGFFIGTLGTSGYVPNMVRMLGELGLPTSRAAEVLGLTGLAVLCGRLGTGLLIDKLFAPWVLVASMVATAAGLAGLAIDGTAFAVPAALLLGFTVGAELDILPYLATRYFGVENVGKVYGALYASIIAASGLSPAFIGIIADQFGSYRPALWVSVGMLIPAIVIVATLPRYARPYATSTLAA
ncbi:MFS transporter [Sphingobium sp. Sx8-8]|uniref:MFS transporter n=1 Tax=Sphingobium sp. Sx8-8 TaxID=2933617 RepID=UPI001F5ACAC5|nr:MFS transporter [Sphingobium sp. Sx8-8]